MAAFLANDLVAMMGPDFYGNEVAHATGGYEEGGFFAEDFGGAGFERVYGGIFEIDVVADFGFGHGAAHCRSWAGDSVAAQVDYVGCALWRVQFPFRVGRGLCWHIFLRGQLINSASALIRQKPRSRCSSVSVRGGRQFHRVQAGLKTRAAENDRISKHRRIFADGPDRFLQVGEARGRALLRGPAKWKSLPIARPEFCPTRWIVRSQRHRGIVRVSPAFCS